MQSEGEGKGDTKKNGISAVCLHLLLPRVWQYSLLTSSFTGDREKAKQTHSQTGSQSCAVERSWPLRCQ